MIELCRLADITFIALHGSVGENGKIQATFDILGIKYTGPNSLGCSLAMNKLVAKQIFKMSRVPTPRGTSLTEKTKDTPLDELGYYLPLVIKPCSSGSSIGVYIVHTEGEYKEAVRRSFEEDGQDEVVIEPYIKGREYACSIVAGKALPLVEIIPKDGVFNYENKYQSGGATELCPPASLDAKTQKKCKEQEKKLLKRSGWTSTPGGFYCRRDRRTVLLPGDERSAGHDSLQPDPQGRGRGRYGLTASSVNRSLKNRSGSAISGSGSDTVLSETVYIERNLLS